MTILRERNFNKHKTFLRERRVKMTLVHGGSIFSRIRDFGRRLIKPIGNFFRRKAPEVNQYVKNGAHRLIDRGNDYLREKIPVARYIPDIRGSIRDAVDRGIDNATDRGIEQIGRIETKLGGRVGTKGGKIVFHGFDPKKPGNYHIGGRVKSIKTRARGNKVKKLFRDL